MKKLILLSILLIVGCDKEEVLGNCVLQAHNPCYFKCYEGLYTKVQCVDKVVEDNYRYYSYNETQSCSDICNDTYPTDNCGTNGNIYCTEY